MGMCLSLSVALAVLGTETAESPLPIFESSASLTANNRVDELLFAHWAALKIQPAHFCSDAVFVRRVYLDAIGTLPTADEASRFLTDTDPNKRTRLIDQLLERKEYAAYWTMKWADLLRVKAEFPINLWPNAAQAYYRWIGDSIRQNKPYDQLVTELLTSSGSNFRVAPVNFFRAMQGKDSESIVQTVALTLMGERSEKWTQERRDAMAVFFSYVGFKPSREWKEEIVYFDLAKAIEELSQTPRVTVFPDGTSATISADQDPRRIFANWLVRGDNPWFARNMANRIWFWLLGRGIVHEPDDFRSDNPPSHPALLGYLETELVHSGFDLKHIYRLVLNSTTYQLASVPRSADPHAAAHFAYYPIRRLDAEVLVDALCQITGTTEKYSSPIPEPFSFIPENQRSITLADGSITSSFLEMFGRPPRDTGLATERNNTPTPSQRLHVLNSSHVQRKLRDGPKIRSLIHSNRSSEEITRLLYLTILSRRPTESEMSAITEYSQSGVVQGREHLEDLAWALVNSAEFLHRH